MATLSITVALPIICKVELTILVNEQYYKVESTLAIIESTIVIIVVPIIFIVGLTILPRGYS